MSLVSRYLEEHGLPTVIIGCARDIVEHCGVARFVFVDFPLGNPCGKPFDAGMQQSIVGQALDLLETAAGPRTTLQAPVQWPKGDGWKDLIFTEAQPFNEGDDYDNWLKKKQLYKELKARGKV